MKTVRILNSKGWISHVVFFIVIQIVARVEYLESVVMWIIAGISILFFGFAITIGTTKHKFED